jgi:hypothetical protein
MAPKKGGLHMLAHAMHAGSLDFRFDLKMILSAMKINKSNIQSRWLRKRGDRMPTV